MANSISSSNPFSLLSDDASDTEVSIPQRKNSQQKSAPRTQTSAGGRTKPSEHPIRHDYPSRGGHRRVIPRSTDQKVEEGFHEGEGRRNRTGPRRGRGAIRGGRRQFDRHSGTGLVDSDKKTRQGWLGDDMTAAEDGDKAAKQANEDNKESESPVVTDAPEEDHVKTLDEYFQEQSSKHLSDESKELRKANDGKSDQALKGTVLLARDDEVFFVGKGTQKNRKNKERREKTYIDIEQRFVDSDRPRRVGFRGNHRERTSPSANQVNIKDQHDFPTLGN